MRTAIVLLTILFLAPGAITSQYYEFPSCGWTQGIEMHDDSPPGPKIHKFNIKKYSLDTVINGTVYKVIKESLFPSKMAFVRQDGGKIFRFEDGSEYLMYDFSAAPGDSVETVFAFGNYTAVIDTKDKYSTIFGDSLIRVTFHHAGYPMLQSVWLEGIGDDYSGLYSDYSGIESAEIVHSTRDRNGILFLREDVGFLTYDFRYYHGEDLDGDSAFNHYGEVRTFEVMCDTRDEYWQILECDTLRIVNHCSLFPFIYVSHGFEQDDWITDFGKIDGDTIWIYDVSSFTHLLLHLQFDFEDFLFVEIRIHPCFAEDCDDADPSRYPCAEEIANNGEDEDCDGADLVISNRSDENDVFRFEIFPNPASSLVNYFVDGLEEYRIVVYDVFGNEIACAMTDGSIDFSQVAAGLYFISLIDKGSGKKEIRRLIIQR